ncbi:type IV secretion system DNA-binding domain-containing protein [Cereibacter sphaeroides]|uniref:type IV secretion system DNA-binding domain-containing protein n=1 Tax=Cereibacter sphaeroides TaxID=1063 RepID=UPI00202A1125|nr:type IV secretion system DNA-binding domain-containing protein [Cereibacter sphaeroides]
MIAELRFLEFLRDDGELFSAREWVKSERPGFVFLTAMPNTRPRPATLSPPSSRYRPTR